TAVKKKKTATDLLTFNPLQISPFQSVFLSSFTPSYFLFLIRTIFSEQVVFRNSATSCRGGRPVPKTGRPPGRDSLSLETGRPVPETGQPVLTENLVHQISPMLAYYCFSKKNR